MDNRLLRISAVLALVSIVSAGCCSQTESYKGGVKSSQSARNVGNCHMHNDNASRGTTKHCHAHVNGNNHTHSYRSTHHVVQPKRSYSAKPRVTQKAAPPSGSHYDYSTKPASVQKKGYYRGSVDSVIDPYARGVLQEYRN